ncbi:MAG: periplasmic heavy metal sensor [Gammaproteobacteria bacterium]|nr:MAG: periplasmic heavy metal sensor [Gammaproteobacteria bacterium]
MMKKLLTAALLTVLAAGTFTAVAVPPNFDRVEGRLDAMTRTLDLTEEQQKQVKAILEERLQQRQAVRGAMHEKIKSVLNDEQKVKLDNIRAEREARWAGRHWGMGPGRGRPCDYRMGRFQGPPVDQN